MNSKPTDLAPLSAIEALADALVRSGAITERERMAILNNVKYDNARNRAADLARSRKAPCVHALPAATDEKMIMNPKLIMSAIEKNRAAMEAQMKKFAALPPKAPPTDCVDTEVTVASLLQRAMLGHLQGAAESLQALAEVGQGQDETLNAGAESMVIDSIATVIDDTGEPQ